MPLQILGPVQPAVRVLLHFGEYGRVGLNRPWPTTRAPPHRPHRTASVPRSACRPRMSSGTPLGRRCGPRYRHANVQVFITLAIETLALYGTGRSGRLARRTLPPTAVDPTALC